MSTPSGPGLSAEQWREKLSLLASHLQRPTSLCIIGSGPGIIGGQPNRVSIDLDTLQRASHFAYSDMKQACEKSGLLFNPQDEIDPNQPYIQIIEEGKVQVGRFTEVTDVMREGGLVVIRPPMENIVASKLLRASDKDFADVAYLVETYGVTRQGVEKVLKHFPADKREQAAENLVFLDAIAQAKQPRPPLNAPAGRGRKGREMGG